MSRIAVVTDSASDLDPARAAALGITVVPLLVSFGDETFSAGIDITREEFWARVSNPETPIATTAACSPGTFQAAFQKAFDDGAEAIVTILVADGLSAANKVARVAMGAFPGREIHIVDSTVASMGEGILAELAVKMAAEGMSAADIAAKLEARRDDIGIFLALDTLVYLRRGGRISAARFAVGTLLGFKPIIELKAGVVDEAGRARTRGKARERLIELLTIRPIERLSVLHTTNAGVEEFAEELIAASGIDRSAVTIELVGPSVGPHLGPGCVGAVALYTEATRPA